MYTFQTRKWKNNDYYYLMCNNYAVFGVVFVFFFGFDYN